MAIASLLIPHFPLRVALLERPELDGLPLVLTSPPSSRTIVADCTPEAERQGIRPGMLLREVTALCPGAEFIPPNPVREAAVFNQLIQNLETFSPVVEPSAIGCCSIDLSGLDRHIASPAAAAERLLQLSPSVLRPRAGVAAGKFTAWVAARNSAPGSFTVVATGETQRYLEPVSVTWLPIPPQMIKRLERLGLRTLADLAALPVTAMAARFGPDGRRAWELASGVDDDRVLPRRQQEIVIEHLDLAAPATSRETLMIGVQQLIMRAFNRKELQHHHVRQTRLQVLLEKNLSWEKEMTLREPVGRQRLLETVLHRLQFMELPGAAEGLIMQFLGIVPATAHQEVLPGFQTRQNRPLIEAIHQLKHRYGQSPLYRVVEVEPWSRIPERRHALITYDP